MVFKTFFLSWKYCTCFWLRLVGIGVKVFRGREEFVLFVSEFYVCFCATFDCVGV